MRQDPLSYLGDELNALKQQNLYRQLRVLDDEQKAHTTFDHRSVVNLSSNNYLGLTTHPRLRQKALEAVEEFGVGTGSVRTIAGTMAMHMELERKLAEFKKVEAVVVFQSGFTANAGTVSAILTKDDVVISDELNHASIIDGCRLSRATIKVFPHKDVDAARKIIEGLPAGQRKLLITDGVFSMDGDLGPLPELCALAEETGCIMMVDDAHASGVFGKNGRGTIDHFGVHGRVDIQVGTLSKAIGALGGYVAGNEDADRVPLSPRPAVPLLDVASAGGGGRVHRRDGRPHGGAGNHRPALGEHAFLQERARTARVRYRHQRESHHAGHRRGQRAGDEAVGPAVRGGRLRPGDRLSDRAERQGAGAHHRHRDAHTGGPAVRARRIRQSRKGAWSRLMIRGFAGSRAW